MSLTEIILTTTGIIVYLEGKERRAASKTQTKQEAITSSYHTALQLLPYGHGHQPHDRKKKTPPEGGTRNGSVARPRAAAESGLGAAVLGDPTCSPSPGTAARGSPWAPEQKLQSCSRSPGLTCLYAHCCEPTTETLAGSLAEKRETVQPSKRPKLHLVNTV